MTSAPLAVRPGDVAGPPFLPVTVHVEELAEIIPSGRAGAGERA